MRARFQNADDAHRKLMESIVFYQDEPVYVDTTPPVAAKLSIMRLTGCKKDIPPQIDFNDPELNLSTPELGYISFDGKTYYCSRNPLRQNTIGISIHNLSFIPTQPSAYIMRSGGMYNMLKNKYETLSEVSYHLTRTNNSRDTYPFHRRFALGRGTSSLPLYFRGDVIGAYHPYKKQIRLIPSDQASFLARQIEALLGKDTPIVF